MAAQFVSVFAAEDDVIHVDGALPITDNISEDQHHSHKCAWGVTEPEVHDRRLKQASWRQEHCLPFISFLDSDIVVTPDDVHLVVDLAFYKHVQ